MPTLEPEYCGHCNGLGKVPGLEQAVGGDGKPVGDLIECPACYGTGLRNKYND